MEKTMSTTVAYIITAVIAFGITAGLGFVIIPWLRKLKFGQTILDIGLGSFCVGKPLDKAELISFRPDTADEIHRVVASGESRGLDVKKDEFLRVAEAL